MNLISKNFTTSLFVIFGLAACAPRTPSLVGPPARPSEMPIPFPIRPVKPTPLPSPSPIPASPSPTQITYSTVHSDVAAMAFEDNFPKAGDADFNDFLTNFRFVEKLNEKSEITEIILDFYPRAVGASYDHSFLLVLSGKKDQPSNISLATKPLFNGDAEVSLVHIDAQGNVLDRRTSIDSTHDIEIFSSTHKLFDNSRSREVINTFANQTYKEPNQMARVRIKLHSPSLNPAHDTHEVDGSNLRMVLHVKNTNKDIDTVDINPKNIDTNGFPFGFIIPSDWRWPREGVSLKAAYPDFVNYQVALLKRSAAPVSTLDENFSKWFLTIGDESKLYPLVSPPHLVDLGVE